MRFFLFTIFVFVCQLFYSVDAHAQSDSTKLLLVSESRLFPNIYTKVHSNNNWYKFVSDSHFTKGILTILDKEKFIITREYSSQVDTFYLSEGYFYSVNTWERAINITSTVGSIVLAGVAWNYLVNTLPIAGNSLYATLVLTAAVMILIESAVYLAFRGILELSLWASGTNFLVPGDFMQVVEAPQGLKENRFAVTRYLRQQRKAISKKKEL